MRVIIVSFSSLCLLAMVGCHGSNYYLGKGNQFFKDGKYQDAAIQYRKALQKDPNSGEALYRLGAAELEQNEFAQAYPLLLRAVQKTPGNDDAKVKLADVCLALYVSSFTHPKVLYDQIAEISGELLAKNPNSFDGLRFRGSLRLLDRNPKEAIEYFQKANQIKPMQRDVIVSLSQALFLDNQPQEGERLARELIRKEPAFGPIYDVLYRHYSGTKRLADAENILKLKVSNNPNNADYIVQLAEHYARLQKPAEMTATLQPLQSDSKRFPLGALKAGDFYAKIGSWAEAQHQFEQGARNDPKDKLVYQKRIVDTLLRQRKRADAVHMVDLILKDHPDDAETGRVRATLRMESGKPEDIDAALGEFGALVKTSPNDHVLRFNYGRCWLLKGDQNRARAEFREAARARPNFIPALNALAQMSLAQRNGGEALGYVQNILSYQPDNINARQLGVDSLMELGRYTEAQAELSRLLKEYPNNPDLQLQLGLLDLAQKKYKEADRVFRNIQGTGRSDSRPAVGLADVYSAQQQFEKAIQVLNEELKKSPNSIAARSLLASTAVRAGKYDLAISTYQELLAKQPKSPDLYTQLGIVYLAKGDHNSAITAFQQAKQLAPNQAGPVILLAASLDRVHRTEEAKANYQRALQLQPENPAVLNNFAYFLAQNGGNLDDALRMVQHALQKEPKSLGFADTLGYIYLKRKMDDTAIQTFSSLVRRDPKSSVFHYHLGMALLETGDKVKAKTEFENALANQPSHDDELRLKELLSRLGA